MEPTGHTGQSLTQQGPNASPLDLNAWIVDYIHNHPQAVVDISTKVASGLLIAFLSFVLILLWRYFSAAIWRFLGYLGSFRGLSKLALWAYRRSVISQYGSLVNIYLGKTEQLSLQQVFVPLTLRATRTGELGENRSTMQILTDDKQKRLVLLGAPGSGKSTLFKALAVGISRSEWPKFRDLEPVLVSLREYAHAVDKQSLLDWLTEHELPRFGMRNPKPLLKSLFSKGRVLLLLDGLDEVTGSSLAAVNLAITKFLDDLDKNKTCRVLLSCREQNYDDLPDRQHYTRDDFTEYRVAELRDSEIREIVRRRQDSFTEKHKSIANYLEQVFCHPSILQLHRNPLLLTLSMGVYLHSPGEEVPHNLAQFYEQSIDNLLRRHDFREAAGRSANRFKAECKFRLLRSFALQNLIEATAENRDFETFSFSAVTTAARQLAEQGKVDFKPDQAHAVVKEIQMQAGLLNALQDGECFLFAHRSLNEYCAAAALNRQNETGFLQISAQLNNPAWRQVIFFYAAIDDDHDNAVHLIEAIKQRADQENDLHLLALAGHCSAVMVQPRKPLRLVLLGALSKETLLTVDEKIRGILLKSLLALGNSRDTEIREQLDISMLQLVELGITKELINEITRLEPSAAFQFLGYLTSSKNLKNKLMALWGLEQLEGQDKIPLLWQLLLDFHSEIKEEDGQWVCETESIERTLLQLLELMDEPGAVEHLNDCEPKPPVPDDTEQKKILNIYPFLLPNQSVSNFVWLLVWADPACFGWNSPHIVKFNTHSWQQFLEMVLEPKTTDELREWQQLPREKDKWTVRIRTTVIGRLLFGLPLLVGFMLLGLVSWWLEPTAKSNDINSLATGLSLLLGVGFTVYIVWLTWHYIINRWGTGFGTLDAFPQFFRAWLLPINQPIGVSQVRRNLKRMYIDFGRSFVLGSAIFLSVLAAFLHNPSLTGHKQSIISLGSTSNVSWLLTGSFDKTARLWDVRTGTELQRFQHNDYVNAVAFAPDKSAVLTGSSDTAAQLWDVKTGAKLQRFRHDNYVTSVTFDPDGSAVLTGSGDKTVRLWNVKTGTELQRFQHDGYVTAVAFAPEKSAVLTGSNDKTARLWNIKTGGELRRFQHTDDVTAVAFAPDGATVLTGSLDRIVRLWEVKTGAVLRRFQHDGRVNAVAFAPDGASVLTGSDDRTARLWDVKTGTELRQFQHADSVYAVAFTPDELGIYTGSSDGAARQWDRQTGELIWETPRPFWSKNTWTRDILYIWLTLIFLVFFLPCLKWFDRGRMIYLRKPNRYIHLYQIPGVQRWLPSADKE